LILIATTISILAVDFPEAFPRRFCKTEEYGISLVISFYFIYLQMDIGVGAVMFSSGLSQRKVRESV
jgi:hypothetical protein